MTAPSPEAELAQIAEAVFQARCAGLAAIAEEEATLRAQLAQLSEMARPDEALDAPALYDARRIAADVTWSVWLDNKRADLNRRLAIIMARKLNEVRKVQKLFGRATVTRDLAQYAYDKASAKQENKRNQRLEAQILMALHQSQPR